MGNHTGPAFSETALLKERIGVLEDRIDDLTRQFVEARPKSRRFAGPDRRWVFFPVLLTAVILVGGGVAIAADGTCGNGLPFCFSANAPAKASEVNHNFSQIKEWIEQKVGATGSPSVEMTDNLTVAGRIVGAAVELPNASEVGTKSEG